MPESNNNSLSSTQTSLDQSTENLNNLQKALINFGIAGHAIGLAHTAEGFADARQRVRDGHLAMSRKAGMEDLVGKNKGEEMNIHIGDVQQPSQPQPTKLPTWVVVALTASSLLASGGVGAGLTALLSKSTPQAVNTTIEKIQGFSLDVVPNK